MFPCVYRIVMILSISAAVGLSWGAKVCIDPGHGGTNPGAVGCGQTEDTNNLNTSLKFRNWMNADTSDGAGGGSWAVYMTHSTDVDVSLEGRVAYANNNAVDRFLSIHNNACGSCGASGTETYSYTATSNDANMRNNVQYRMIQAWGLTNRGNKTYDFYVCKYTNMPATLSELGFIDTCSIDANYVGNATRQDSAALAHLYGLQVHLGIPAYKPGSTPSLPTYTLDNSSAGFSVTGTWATGSSSADKYGADYRYRSTAAVSEPAQWSINVGVAGTYRIQAWWPAGTNRSTAAPYITPGGASPKVNQQINGGKWNVLATESLGTGARITKLSCWAATGFVVVADAVRYGP